MIKTKFLGVRAFLLILLNVFLIGTAHAEDYREFLERADREGVMVDEIARYADEHAKFLCSQDYSQKILFGRISDQCLVQYRNAKANCEGRMRRDAGLKLKKRNEVVKLVRSFIYCVDVY